MQKRLSRALTKRVDGAKADLHWCASALQQRVVRLAERRRARIATLGGRLHALSPLATLSRGFAVARATDGTALTSTDRFHAHMPFQLVLRDGMVSARATAVEKSVS
jgi:exodeoxyribonuclease VII large subunit